MSRNTTLIINGTIVNECCSFSGALLLVNDKIERVIPDGEALPKAEKIIDAKGMLVIPGLIDDQVHFREPGNTNKGTISSESGAAVLGGVTSYMDMPNNNPPSSTVESLRFKD